MYSGKAELKDGRTLSKRGSFSELTEWVENLMAIYGCLSITITKVSE